MTLEEIEKRLEEATGPDREIDGEIMFTLFAKPVGENGFLWPEDDPSWSFAIRFPGKTREWFKPKPEGGERILVWRDGHPILMNELRVPKLTASIDAAVALVERLMAMVGHVMWTRQADVRYDNRGKVCFHEITIPSSEFRAHHRCETHAILLSGLRAYRALRSKDVSEARETDTPPQPGGSE